MSALRSMMHYWQTAAVVPVDTSTTPTARFAPRPLTAAITLRPSGATHSIQHASALAGTSGRAQAAIPARHSTMAHHRQTAAFVPVDTSSTPTAPHAPLRNTAAITPRLSAATQTTQRANVLAKTCGWAPIATPARHSTTALR